LTLAKVKHINNKIISKIDLVLWLILRRWQLLPGGLHSPNLAGVLGDGAIRREFAAGRNVVDGHLQPLGLVLQIRQKYRGLNNDLCYLFF